MKESTKGMLVRSGKLIHYLATVILFAVCCEALTASGILPSPTALHMEILTFLYAVILAFSLRAYSAYHVGFAQVGILVYSQTLATLVSDGMMYVLFLIDQFTFINPLPFFGLLAVQFLLNCGYSWAANRVYFRIHPPKKTVVIYRNEEDPHRINDLTRHPKKYQIVQTIKNPSDDIHALLREMDDCEAVFVEHNIRCYVAPHVGDIILMGGEYMELFSVPVLRVTRAAPKIGYLMLKRFTDILFSFLGIVVCSPVMLITALAVKLCDGGPVLYKQVRLTKDGREFKILKFRSMRVNAEKDGVARLASQNDDRITPVGKIIRACRLDELPQLFNILRGDMSIVGPRPERPEIARQYEQILPAFSLRLQVKAGLTGFAQVYGKYNTDPYDKLRMDLMYINQMSFLQDIRLMLSTAKVLFMKESTSGISDGQITAAAKKDGAREFTLK